MKVKYVVKEYPVLSRFFGWYFPDKEEPPKEFPGRTERVVVKRLGTDVLKTNLSTFSHSWAGSQGTIAWAVFADGSWQRLKNGTSGSDNGRMWDGDEDSQIWENFIKNGEVDDDFLQALEAIVIEEWDDYNNPTYRYDDYTVYLRPRKNQLREVIEKEFRKALNEITAVVEG